jgi:hypothetical protein
LLARKLDDASEVARLAGTSVTKAKATVQTAKALADADEVRAAFQDGDISCEQAPRSPGRNKRAPALPPSSWRWPPWRPSTCSKTRARKIVLEAEQHRGLAQRQREARGARSHADDLGMVHIELALEPHVGTPIVNRAEAEAGRLYREAKKQDQAEPFGRHLADAYAALLAGTGKCGPRRPELSVLVSHGVAQRGWKDVEEGEVCKIPGVGPVAPQVAKEIARDAFLTGVFYDGKDLRQLRRWTRNTPVEVRLALQLGPPPDFDGVRCVDCGNRFRIENDHVEPHCRGGPASTDNFEPRCWPCHVAKTERDRRAGKLPPPAPERSPPP